MPFSLDNQFQNSSIMNSLPIFLLSGANRFTCMTSLSSNFALLRSAMAKKIPDRKVKKKCLKHKKKNIMAKGTTCKVALYARTSSTTNQFSDR